MLSPKLIILFILSLFMGVVFIVLGFYFYGKKFLNKLIEASPVKDEKTMKKITLKAKGSAYVSFGLGGLTIVWGIVLFCMPAITSILAFVYMIMLIIAFIFLTFVFK